jgi:signal transduction histidine kinase
MSQAGVVPAITTLLSAALAIAALLPRRRTRRHLYFALINVGTFFWSAAYAFGYGFSGMLSRGLLPTLSIGFIVGQVGVALATTYWFLFSMEVAGVRRWTSGWRSVLVHVPGAALVVASLTNPLHHLFITVQDPRSPSGFTYGPLAVPLIGLCYALVVVASVLYVRRALTTTGRERTIARMLAPAGLGTLIVDVVWTTRGLTGLALPYNPTMLVLVFMDILIAVAVFGTGLIDVVSFAEGEAFRSMTDAAVVFSADWRILALNPAAERILPAAVGSTLAEVAAALGIADPIDVPESPEGRPEIDIGDRTYWVRLEQMRTRSGREIGQLLLLTDLTVKRASEREIMHLYERLTRTVLDLEDATRAKDDFIASMNHELRTPLQAVVGYLSMVLRGVDGTLEASQREHLETALDSARHLSNVIESLLDMSSLQAGSLRADPRPFDGRETAQRIVRSMEGLAARKGLELRASYDGLGVLVTDETRLRQVLVNLMANAIKFTERGQVTLEARRAGALAVFRVADTGPGIPPEELEHIFEAFRQVETGDTKPPGTGLGLYVSRALTQMLGGSLTVTSVPGSGTVFELSLPADISDELEAPHDAAEIA